MTDIRGLLNQAKKAGLRLQVEGTLLRIKGAVKNTELAKELLDRKKDVIKILKAHKSGPRGALTPARCHEDGCNGLLFVSGMLRKCSECGAEIRRWLYRGEKLRTFL
jgi:hypothetical protein